MRFSVIATDLDGTLLRDDKTISSRTRDALARASAVGARHVVVTGRPARNCATLLKPLGYQGWAVCGQGTELYDVGTDRLRSLAVLDRRTVRALLSGIADVAGPLQVGVVTAGLSSEFVVTPDFGDRIRHGWRVAESRSQLWAEEPAKVLVQSELLDDETLAALARAVCQDEVTVTCSGEGLVELVPAGVSKASGLAAAAQEMGFTAAQTIAFGDMPNDIPMIEWAGYGVAMGNAHPDVRCRADETAPTNHDDGVAVVLERLLAAPAITFEPLTDEDPA